MTSCLRLIMADLEVVVLSLRITIKDSNSISSLTILMVIVIDDRLIFPKSEVCFVFTFVNHSLNNKHTIYSFTCHPRPLRTCPSRFL